MTLIEFYDETSIENAVGFLICKPQYVVFLGDNLNEIKKHIKVCREIAKKRDLKIDFLYKKINIYNLKSITDGLCAIIEASYGECILDLNGGEDLTLVAAGIAYERYKKKVRLQRLNIENCTQHLSIEENIRLYGGSVIETDGLKSIGKWDFDNEDFAQDVVKMWNICRNNPKLWNHETNSSGGFGKEFRHILTKNGLITQAGYKNENVKKCLSKAGQILEIYVAYVADKILNEKGEKLYNDILTGVSIDWDGRIPPKSAANVDNEIDVILMKDLIPVFISCKNGIFDTDELYKLSAVAERFGGKYAKKVIVAADMERLKSAGHIRARAKEMDIKIIENIRECDDEKVSRIIGTIWQD